MPGDITVKLAPSVLSADYSRLGEAAVEATDAGADYIHIDVMDGQFVPPITVGAQMVSALRPCTDLPLDVHLMIVSPEHQIKQFAEAGADIITVHQEACTHLHRTIQQMKGLGVRAGVSLCPSTPIDTLEEILPELDLVLIMSVNPGFGGQTFIESILDKIARMRAELDRRGLTAELEVDGGIYAGNAAKVVKAGARVLVAGAAVFASGASVQESLGAIRSSLE
jgi:ribulose-phosphate 3-epimerase